MPSVKELFNSAADGVYAIDRKQRIIYWDQGCEELFGYSSNWVLGRPCYDVIQGCTLVSETRFCQKDCSVSQLHTGSGKGPKNFKIQVKNADSKPIILTVNIVLVPAECKSDWIVTHFLHKEKSPTVLRAFEYAQKKNDLPCQKTKKSSSESEIQPGTRLTNREREILLLLAEGLSCSSISERLTVSNTTVRNHIQHILSKLCVHSRTEAVAYAYRHELI